MSTTKPARQAIEENQLFLLNHLLTIASGSNSFYQIKLKEGGLLSTSPRSLDEFFARMPFTTKHELAADQQENPPFGTNLTFALSDYTRFHQTSGTTRRPIHWLDTEDSWQAMLQTWKKVYRAAEVHVDDHIFFAFSFGPFLGFWTAFEAAESLGCMCVPGGGMSSTARLQIMRDIQATVLCCTPTYALHLAETARHHNFDLSSLHVKKLIVAGEPGAGLPATRSRIEEAWNGARLFDHHGMTEVGPVSYEMADTPGYLHIDESAFIAEILNPETLQPAAEGETGELVLTTLSRIGMPLIRYRTSDLVKPDWSGRPKFKTDDLALKGGIIGRLDDMVVVRGVNLFPSAVEDVLRSFKEIVEYQVKIFEEQSMTQVALEIEVTDSCENAYKLAHAIEAEFKEAFQLRIPVTVMPTGSLPRYEMKAKRWIRE